MSKADPTTSIDMSDYLMVFDVRTTDNSADAIISKTPIVTGTFNATRSLNTQRAIVTLTDDDTNLFRAKAYRFSWKRLDENSETVLAWGDFSLQKATAP